MAQKFLTGVQLTDGGAGSPALSFSSDTNTGIYRSADDHVNISVGGTNMFKVSSAGITSSVNVYSGTSGQFRNYAGIWKATTGASGGDAQFILNGKTIMHIDEADERVGIGNTSPYAKLHITGADSTASAIRQSRTGTVIWDQAIDSSGRLQWGTRASEGGTRTVRFTLDDNGNVGVGTGSPGYTLDVSGSLRATGESTFTSNLLFPDNSQIKLGTGQDLQIYHDGTDTKFVNSTGDLIFRNQADDKDIIFKCDDGSGGVEEYFRLDGSVGGADPVTRFPDSSQIQFGTGGDSSIRFDGSKFEVTNSTGHFEIINYADDSDIIFKSDNGSGGTTEYFRMDGSAVQMFGSVPLKLGDSKELWLGNASDFYLTHDGTNNFIIAQNGPLYIRQTQDDQNIYFQCDDGSGGITTYFELDGNNVLNKFRQNLYLLDNVGLKMGNSFDLSIKHDGSDSYIQNETGHLYIQQFTNDKDIIFQSDDGSGGTTTYFFLDGSSTTTQFYKTIKLYDDAQIYIGDGNDLRLYHNGTSNIDNYTGNLDIIQRHNDGDIRFYNDDGSGGTTEYFRVDGGVGRVVFSKDLRINDGLNLYLGNQTDLVLSHNGTNSYISNYVGDLIVENAADGRDLILKCDNGSGGVANYLILDGSQVSIRMKRKTKWDDNIKATFGDGEDLQIYHDATNTEITNLTGNLNIKNTATDGNISFYGDNASGGVTEYFRLDGGNVNMITSVNNVFADGKKAAFGDSADLQIWHDGSNSFIQDVGTGNLFIEAVSSIQFRKYNTAEFMAKFINDGAVELYHDNSKKLETTNTGVTITGNLTVSGTTTTVNQTNLDVSDNIIGLNRGASTNTNDSGIIIERGTTGDNAAILWDESSDDFVFGLTTATPSATGNVSLSDFRGIRTGPITVSGNLTVGADSDRLVTLGRAKVGSYVSDYAYFSHFDYGTLSNYALNQSPTGNTSINAPTGGHVQLKINNSAKVTLVGDKVGIGTASPGDELEVVGNLRIKNANGSNPTDAGSLIFAETAGTWGTNLYGFRINQEGSSNYLNFQSANTTTVKDILTLTRDTARVGIGVTSPSYPFHVYNADAPSDILARFQTADNSTYIQLVSAGSSWQIGATSDSLDWYNDNNSAVRMSLLETGNLGIGTTSPGQKLEVAGEIKSDGYRIDLSATTQRAITSTGTDSIQFGDAGVNEFKFKNAAGTSMIINSSGNVGIGTTSPAAKFNVQGSGTIGWGNLGNALVLAGTTSYGIGIDANEIAGKGDNLYFGTIQNHSIIIRTNGANERMRITNTGNVGIANTSPAYKLDVGGTSRIGGTIHMYGAVRNYSGNFSLQQGVQDSDIFFKVNDGGTTTTVMTIDGSESTVGIGTTAPQTNTKLEVSGAIKAGNKTSWSDRDGAALTTTGRVVAGLTGNANGNGASALYIFTCYGGNGYQRIVYSCRNQSGTWVVNKDIDEGVDAMDVVASTPSSGSAVTFTFKGRTSSQSYTASVFIEHMGHNLDTQYVG